MVELPEARDVGGIVGAPALVLVARQGVEVDDRPELVLRAKVDHAVEVLDPGLIGLERLHVVFEMPVGDGKRQQIEVQRPEEPRIAHREEVV